MSSQNETRLKAKAEIGKAGKEKLGNWESRKQKLTNTKAEIESQKQKLGKQKAEIAGHRPALRFEWTRLTAGWNISCFQQ
jgi:hypothetical protein